MSNVLIGIIGVILFIGLALSGALFLGTRFQESANTSKAAANVQAIQQIGNAIEMYRVNEDRPFDPTYYPGNLEGTYLKNIPTMQGMDAASIANNIGAVQVDGKSVSIIRSKMSDTSGRAICEAAQKQLTGTTEVPQLPTDRMGCYVANSRYFFYNRVDIL